MKNTLLLICVLFFQTTLFAQTSGNELHRASIYDSLATDICECTNEAVFNKMSETGRTLFGNPDMTAESLKKEIEEAIKSDSKTAEIIQKDLALLDQAESAISDCVMARMLKYGDVEDIMSDDSETKIMDSMKNLPFCKAFVQLALLSSAP